MSEPANAVQAPASRSEQVIDKVCLVLSTTVAIVMCVFHLLAASPFLLLNNTELAVVHGAFIVTFFVLVRRLKADSSEAARVKVGKFLYGCAIVSGILCLLFVWPPIFSKSPFTADEKSIFKWLFIVSAILSVLHLVAKKLPALHKVVGAADRVSLPLFDIFLIVITILCSIEVIRLRNSNSASATLYSDYQYFVMIMFVMVALCVGYRALGKILPTLCILFIIYSLFGRYLPGVWESARLSVKRLGSYLAVGSEGLFGSALSTAGNYIFLFVLFGSVLSFIGAGEFFVKIAFSAFGKVCGGPAQAAIYSSMLMGMVNGSGAANVVTTGTFTIPLMKRTGFDPDTAGAVEAVASNGGQIMPPVMGAVAFLMADATGMSYGNVCLAALIPAVLYYLTLSVSVLAYSHKHKIPVKEPDPNEETTGQIFKKGWFFFLPIVALIVMMVMGYSTKRAALITIIMSLIIGLIHNPKNFTLKNLKNLCVDSAKSMMTVSIACMIAGIIVGAINVTGFGLKISGLIEMLAGGSILLMGILTALVCILLGMGLPTAACYIVLSILIAPAMVDIGVSLPAAHLFVLYYGVIAAITPPVALAVFAAIGISGGEMWKTGLQAMKLAISGLLIPFVFLYNDDLLLYNAATATFGMSPMVILSVATAFLGCAILGLALFGWCGRDLKMLERVLLVPCAIALMLNQPLWANGVGFVVAAVILGLAILQSKKEKRSLA
ncbi:MAG: TRAP transporter fused permease subunit [Clostridia bacterium]|nr:TRAP transporter fused permease subunit [Clostridia bacterium]